MRIKLPMRVSTMLALLIGLAVPAAAQKETDKVIATIGGKPVYQSELTIAAGDQQFERLTDEQKTAAALSALLDIKAMARQVENAGMGKDHLFQRRMGFLRDRTLHNDLFKTRVVDGMTDAAVPARYDQEVATPPPEKEVKARHILVDSEEQAKAVIGELDAGKDFIELAKEKSTGPSGPQGGDLGYFGRGRMIPEFEETAFVLEPGSYTKESVKSQFGWHIIRVDDVRDMAPPPFEQVADQIRRVLLQERYLALVQEARSASEVEVTDQDLQALPNKVNTAG